MNTSSCVPFFTLICILFDLAAQVNIDEGYLNLMFQDGTEKDDVRVPEGDVGKQITEGFEDGKELLVTIISAMGEEQVSHLMRNPYTDA
jgi:translation initiation factor 5A